MNNKFCPKCGHKIIDETGKCEKCGFESNVIDDKLNVRISKKSVIIITVFAVLLVVIGFFAWATITVDGDVSEAMTIISHGSFTCFKNHDFVDATCQEPKHCSRCGFSEGEKIHHDWEDATCLEPEKCKMCGMTHGGTVDHQWAQPTCTEPSVCVVCGATKGNALGHYYVDYICTRCGNTSYSYADIKNIIKLSNLNYEMGWSDSVDLSFNITNGLTEKTIKYVYLTIEFYNAAGNVLVDDTDNSDSVTIECTGLINPGETSYTYNCQEIFYNENFEGSIGTLECKIIYTDGTTIELDEAECTALWQS